jgi:CRP-like cAMP-binding protein
MDIQTLIDHFAHYLPLDEEEIGDLESRLIQRNIKKRQFILQEGDVCKHDTFVIDGCFKMYKVDKKRKRAQSTIYY